MRTLRALALAAVLPLMPFASSPAGAEPAELTVALDQAAAQAIPISFTDPSLTVYPLGTARVQVFAVNPTSASQAFFVQLLVLRPDGTVAASKTTDVLSLAAAAGVDMVFTVPRSDYATRVILIPFSV